MDVCILFECNKSISYITKSLTNAFIPKKVSLAIIPNKVGYQILSEI